MGTDKRSVQLLHRKSPILLFVALALVGVVVGLWGLAAVDGRLKPAITVVEADPDLLIAVAIEGPITNPGVYRLPEGSRIVDLIAVAGGETETADLATVNLARILTDGEMVAIPEIDASISATPGNGSTSEQTGGMGLVAADGRLNLNTASLEELDGLPGIGPVLAEAIIAERERTGGFAEIDDLADIAGISPRMVDELRHLVKI